MQEINRLRIKLEVKQTSAAGLLMAAVVRISVDVAATLRTAAATGQPKLLGRGGG
jgi:hypothetical protein